MDGLLELQLYKNPCYYPKYSETITPIGGPFTVTPRNLGLESGHIDVGIDFGTLTQANYLSITNQNFTFYAYIDRVEHVAGEHHFRIIYHVDPLRTYKDKISLGYQYVVRNSTPTDLYDELLGSDSPYPEISITQNDFGHPYQRTLVVQARHPESAPEMEPGANVPGNPYRYRLYFTHYDCRNPLNNSGIDYMFALIKKFIDPYLVITVYSCPYISAAGLQTTGIWLQDTQSPIGNNYWYTFPYDGAQNSRLTTTKEITIPTGLTRIDSTIEIVIPEAGILQVPTAYQQGGKVYIRRDIDILSGLANYWLLDSEQRPTPHSVRGGGVANIPMFSDPMETYISQNQNSLAVSTLGDVATIATGIGLTIGGAAPAGISTAAGGAMSLISRTATIKDAATSHTNPPAFLGSALIGQFSDLFWVIIKKSKVNNYSYVNTEKGYPQGRIMPATFPKKGGYLETRNCNIETDGSVPMWAVTKINQIFDSGLKVV